MMTDKKDLRKNLNICLLLTLLLCVLAVVPLFAPQADWRLNAAILRGRLCLCCRFCITPKLFCAGAGSFCSAACLPWKAWRLQPARRG